MHHLHTVTVCTRHHVTHHIVAITLHLAHIHVVLSCPVGAILRGCGRLWAGASMNVLSWWVIGVPLAYYLAIVEDHNMQGLWVGFATAGVVQSGLQVSAPSPHSHRVHTPSRDASHCHNHDPPHST